MKLTGQVAAVLVTLSTIANGVGAFLLSADEVPFGFDPYDVGLSLVWFSTIATVIVVAIRRDLIPGITSGVGLEK